MEGLAEELYTCLHKKFNGNVVCRKSSFLAHVKKRGCSNLPPEVFRDGMLLASKLVVAPLHALEVASSLPYLLVELLSLATVDLEEGLTSHERDLKCQQEFVALAKLSRVHPDALKFSFHYFETRTPKFVAPVPGTKSGVSWISAMAPQDIIQSFYLFLQAAPLHFRRLWNWPEIVSHYLPQGSMLTWLSVQCAATVMHMDAEERGYLGSQHLSASQQQQCSFTWELLSKELDDTRNLMSSSHIPSVLESAVGSYPGLHHVVPAAGVLLPIVPGFLAGELFLHMVPTTKGNLRRLAVAVASEKAVCLVGPGGSGKTDLVEQLACLTGRNTSMFAKLQMSEEIDSKLLVGTYTTTSSLGEFKWEPGILTNALMKGQWLLVEDIDLASPDVAAVLSSVLEQGSLLVPGCEQPIKAASGFHLFFTQRSSSPRYASTTNLLKEHWLQVFVYPLTKKELLSVVKAKYPLLEKWASRIVRMYLLFSDGSHHCGDGESEEQVVRTNFQRSHSARHTSTRDLMKYCQRIEESNEQTLFRHALDIFCSNIADRNMRVKLAVEVGFVLGLAENISYQFCTERVPHFEMRRDELQIGSVTLDVVHSAMKSTSGGRRFSWTLPAAAVMESIACCVHNGESVLLVGETATGKTLMVQHLADLTGTKVVVVNMSQQSDPADLLGGYKPVNMFWSLHNEFEVLLESCSDRKTGSVLKAARKFFNSRNWSTWLCLLTKISKSRLQHYSSVKVAVKDNASAPLLEARWFTLHSKLEQLDKLMKCKRLPSLKFVEGTLVKAVTEGYWILLDEINLATPEMLHCLGSLLEGRSSSLQLLERGGCSTVARHPNFRLFACMNPSTDVGKRQLPQGLRNRFTEIYVDEMTSPVALIPLVQCYLRSLDIAPSLVHKLVKFYLSLRSNIVSLADGTGRKPHYSLRTLCRALSIAAENKCGSVKQSLFEGMCIAFLTQLKRDCYIIVEDNIRRIVFGGKNMKGKPVALPKPKGESAVLVEDYWITQGTPISTSPETKYVLTETVRANLRELARAVSLADCPILLQGPTSVGKTSLVKYLAASSRNHCVRINNHEHTDLQEYVGMHAADDQGQLVFQYGVLVEAMKKGHWLILDELNLAPTDVLEALNRLLDDNRELYITETQELVKAHKNFKIFATQNPPGVYGGRKVLSRAFRNRFVELHFDSIPPKELQEILHKYCSVPPNCCKSLVSVMNKLQLLRKGSATFAGRQGFMTLRDLFRWARRYHVVPEQSIPTFYDWDQHMAEEGFLLLSGRVRKPEERIQIQDTIQKVFKKNINPDNLYDLTSNTSLVTRYILEKLMVSASLGHDVVWTRSMRQMAVLLCKAHQYDEPVLLVGGTGCGKTTLCQKMSAVNGQRLFTINCHMNSEGSDFLGGLRPSRNHSKEKHLALFEWVDGPLVLAMKEGGMFLADEISLAEDSVLERLNPLLEPERVLLLSEKGSDGLGTLSVKAHPKFQFVGTMNPGGDFGKKELSPALRNRFTEIWCEPFSDRKDLEDIINFYLCSEAQNAGSMAQNILEFIDWYKSEPLTIKVVVSIRDILTWVSFINTVLESRSLTLDMAFIHGAMMTLVNGMCVGDTGSLRVIESEDFESIAFQKLKHIIKLETDVELVPVNLENFIHSTEKMFGIGDFHIEKGAAVEADAEHGFVFTTAQTCEAALHVLRAMQLHRPILLEGSPGVGKTALVQALAYCAGYKLTRINLSEQTDVSDLFGADLPVEEGEPGQFAWHDGPFLQALKAGDWILLDELNLSSQSVLEGLNACLDHRREVYIPELGKTFHIKKGSTRIFATQNPTAEGGGRRGLPKSLLNRFLKVYIKRLRHDTYKEILGKLFPKLDSKVMGRFLMFLRLLLEDDELAAVNVNPGSSFNLRDACRWCRLVSGDHRPTGPVSVLPAPPDPCNAAHLIYFGRMRTEASRSRITELFNAAFEEDVAVVDFPVLHVEEDSLRVGQHVISQGLSSGVRGHRCMGVEGRLGAQRRRLLLRSQVPVLEALLQCITMAWHPLLIGGPASGKTSVVELLAELVGVELRVLPMSSAMDTMEILGGFEQCSVQRHLRDLMYEVDRVVSFVVREAMLSQREGLAENVWKMANKWWCNTWVSTEGGPADVARHCDTMRSVLESLAAHWKAWSPACCCSLDIGDLLARLARVREQSSRGVSTGGGKFEWVDSLLVKCLKDGAWLLVENVNLCSSAVLDRLNALLEPNGLLCIDERGVGPDDKVVTVRPHPNFRIMFTMNPDNGEVSRAMRNRCVEIFMKPMMDVLSKLDCYSVLADLGLQSPSVLSNIHEEIAPFDNFGHLTRVAYIASQQAVRGLSVNNALKDTILDNHIVLPGRISKIELGVRLSAVVDSDGTVSKTILDHVDLKAATLKTAALNEQRAVSIARQDCVLLGALLRAGQHGLPDLLRLLPNTLGLDCSWMYDCDPVEVTTLFAIATFSSSVNCGLKAEWVTVLLREAADEHVTKAVTSLCNALPRKESTNLLEHVVKDFANWLLMELVVASANHKHMLSQKPIDNTIRIVDAPSYFGLFQNNPLVSKCVEIIDMFDDFLEKLLKSKKFVESKYFSDTVKVDFLFKALMSRIHFSTAMFTIMYENRDGSWMMVQSSLKKLQIYYKWFFDAVMVVEACLINSQVSDVSMTALRGLMPQVEASDDNARVAKLHHHPPAWFTRGWPALLESLRRISTSVCLWDEITDCKIHVLLDCKYEVASKELISLIAKSIADKNPPDEVVGIIERVEEAAGHPQPREEAVTLASARVSLWPVQELLCVKLCSLLRVEMQRRPDCRSLVDEREALVAQVAAALCALPTVPLGMKVYAQALLNTSRAGDSGILRVSYEVAALLLEHAMTMPATASLSLWQANSTKTSDTVEKVLPSLHCPALAILLKQLLQGASDQFSLPTLDSNHTRVIQLRALHEMLWRNFVFFTSPQTDMYLVEKECILRAAEGITSAVHRATGEHKLSGLQSCIPLLRLHQDDEAALCSAARWVEHAVECLRGDGVDWTAVGLAWTALGLLRAKLEELRHVSDWERRESLASATHEVTYLSKRLFALDCWNQVKMCSILSSPVLRDHLAISTIMKYFDAASSRKRELEDTMPERPSDEDLQNMSQVRSSYLLSITSPDTILRLLQRLCTRMDVLDMAAEIELLVGLNEHHVAQLRKYSDWFPDYIQPVVLAAAQISYGLSILRSTETSHNTSMTELNEDYLLDLIRYPVYKSTDSAIVDVVHRYLDIPESSTVSEKRGNYPSKTLLRLQVLALQDLSRDVVAKAELDSKTWVCVRKVLKYVLELWRKQKVEAERKRKEEESLYKTRTKTQCEELSDDELFKQDMERLFHNSERQDFGDLQESHDLSPPLVDQTLEEITDAVLITEDYLHEIHCLHSRIVSHVICDWLAASKNKDEASELDHLSPWLERYQIFNSMIEGAASQRDASLDQELYTSYLLVTSAVVNLTEGGMLGRHVSEDFYTAPNIAEVVSIIPVLNTLLQEVNRLLAEWPENPILVQIVTVVKRILSFPVESPVSRFLAGLEILLPRVEVWEVNAHQGVSLGPSILQLNKHILAWKRLELSSWKGLLSAADRRAKVRGSQWWPHVYEMLHFTLEPLSKDKFLDVMWQFMQESVLGEFCTRLQILYSFHCDAVMSHLDGHVQKVLWNVCKYFSQFLEPVDNMIASLRAPIEKKLKDLVKISSWNYSNVAALKKSFEKSKRAVVKCVREYEAVLKQPAFPSVTLPELSLEQHTKTLARLQSLMAVDAELYVLNQEYADDSKSSSSLERKWCCEFRNTCINLVAASNKEQTINAVYEWCAETFSSYVHLTNLQVDRSAPLDKQKSWAKSTLQQKRRFVSNLFKELQAFGVSHRWGAGSESSTTDLMYLPPTDVAAMLSHLEEMKMDEQLVSMWKESEQLFHKNIARLKMLRQTLNNPSKDMEMYLIGRMRGCTSHLMFVTAQEKVKFNASLKSLCTLRYLTWQVISVGSATSKTMLHEHQAEVKTVLVKACNYVTQLIRMFDTCPKSSCGVDASEVMDGPDIFLQPLTVFGDGPALGLQEEIKVCSDMIVVLNEKRSLLKDKLNVLQQHVPYMPHRGDRHDDDLKYFLSPKTKQDIDSAYETLLHVGTEIKDLCQEKCSPFSGTQLTRHMMSLSETMLRSAQRYFARDDESTLNTPHKRQKQEACFKAFLDCKIVELIHRVGNVESQEQHAQNILKVLERLDGIWEALNVDVVVEDLYQHLTPFWQGTSPSVEDKIHLASLVPLLEQFVCLCQLSLVLRMSVCQALDGLMTTVLVIFEALASKGYQIPEELMPDEDGEGDGGTGKGGMGLGDGEGEKDVSDRIESEDQLEEARPSGEKPPDESDQQCPEENENGIDMSEDFGGEVGEQKQATDEEEGAEQSDGENADDEMGSASDNEQDKPYWGSDQSGDEADGDGDDEEGKGQEQRNKEKTQLGAKEESEQNEGSQEERNKEVDGMDDGEEAEDHVDPYHGNMEPQPEPEPLEMPDDLQLDDGEAGEEQNPEEETNPFDIDEMREVEEKDKEQDQGEDGSKDEGTGDEAEEARSESDGENGQLPEEQTANESGANAEEDGNEGEAAEVDTEQAENSTEQQNAGEEAMDAESGVQDQATSNADVQEKRDTEKGTDGNREEAGVGQAEWEKDNSGHQGDSHQDQATESRSMSEEPRQAGPRQRPRESEHRTLGSAEEPAAKRLKTVEAEERVADERADTTDEADVSKDSATRQDQLHQHVKDSDERDTQTLDTATSEQAQAKEWHDIELDNEDQLSEQEACPEVHDEEMGENKLPSNRKNQKTVDTRDITVNEPEQKVDEKTRVGGEVVQTMRVERGQDIISQNQVTFLTSGDGRLPEEQASRLRELLLEQLSSWTETLTDDASRQAWSGLCVLTSPLAQELSEQLRMILEPTTASRLKGDYKSGRRINMRKVIPYIASGFRKDKIWLRRTKLSKRDYQILLAIDDSQSMQDNRSKELAFESLALVSQALVLLEAGHLGVISFGEEPVLLHPLSEPFTDSSGSGLVQRLEFKQERTRVGKLVEFATCMFSTQPSPHERAQLLIVISDGRGVDSEGPDVVRNAVQQALENNIFIVYIIVDNPQESILDVCSAVFEGSRPRLTPYMESFPFPFYMVLKDINMLPMVLSDALRQWFELVASVEQ